MAPCHHCLGSQAGKPSGRSGKLGWKVVVQQGSHAQLKHPSRGGRVTVPLMLVRRSGRACSDRS
ncbi:MAG: type II toxin-antitoxin system HicA family toxin [Streptosporangiaceae bacterium]